MANPVLATSQSSSGSGTSLVATFPSGLTAGDEMNMIVSWYDNATSPTLTTPSGWTSKQNAFSNFVGLAMLTKTATAGDVSDGSVTLTFSTGSGGRYSFVSRITGSALGSEIAGTEIDSGDDTTSPSHTTAITPVTAESLVIMAFAGTKLGAPFSKTSLSAYATTPTVTFTEAADLGDNNGDLGFGIAYGDYDGTTQFTARTATFSSPMNRQIYSVIAVYTAPVSATGTNTLLSVSPSFFAPTGRADTNGTNTLLSVSPTIFSQSGRVTGETAWTNEDPASTTWTNETI